MFLLRCFALRCSRGFVQVCGLFCTKLCCSRGFVQVCGIFCTKLCRSHGFVQLCGLFCTKCRLFVYSQPSLHPDVPSWTPCRPGPRSGLHTTRPGVLFRSFRCCGRACPACPASFRAGGFRCISAGWHEKSRFLAETAIKVGIISLRNYLTRSP